MAGIFDKVFFPQFGKEKARISSSIFENKKTHGIMARKKNFYPGEIHNLAYKKVENKKHNFTYLCQHLSFYQLFDSESCKCHLQLIFF